MISPACPPTQADDLLQAYPAFTKYDRRGLQAELRYYHGGDRLPQVVRDWAFGLTKAHMQVLGRAGALQISRHGTSR